MGVKHITKLFELIFQSCSMPYKALQIPLHEKLLDFFESNTANNMHIQKEKKAVKHKNWCKVRDWSSCPIGKRPCTWKPEIKVTPFKSQCIKEKRATRKHGKTIVKIENNEC